MPESIILHYKVHEGHKISSGTLVKSIKSTEVIARAIANLIAPNSKIRVLVKPPREGSFLLEIVIGAAVLPLGKLIVTEFVTGMVKEWTGSETPFEDMGRTVANDISLATTAILNSTIESISKVAKTCSDDESKVVKEKIIKPKSSLFKACEKDENIAGVGFSHLPDFIPKVDFQNHCLDNDVIQDKDIMQETSSHSYFDVKAEIVTATTVENKNQVWGLRILEAKDQEKMEEITARMNDRNFLNHFLAGEHPLRTFDRPDLIHARIEVKEISKKGSVARKAYSIEKVYSFNNKVLADVEPISSIGERNLL